MLAIFSSFEQIKTAMRKKILFIRQNMPGGTDNYCKSLYNLLRDDADLCPLPVADIPAIPSRLFHYYYKSQPLEEAIREADIVHINGYTAMGSIQAMRTAHRLGKKVVYTAHWHPFSCLRHPLLGKLFFRLLFQPIIRKCADVVTTINYEDYKFFTTFHHNVVRIPHWFQPLAIDPVKKKPNMILFVGRTDDPVQGIEHLYQLPRGQDEVHCAGRGTIARDDFHQHINLSPDELAQLYAEASLVVVPSKYEAFSYVTLEAMSYGTPVLMSQNVRIADYLDGISGWRLFRYSDYVDFLQKAQQTIGTTVETAKIIEAFSPEKSKETYRSVYLE